MITVRQSYKILFISINNAWRYGNVGMDQLLGYLRNKKFNIDILYFNNKFSAERMLEKINMTYDMYAFSVNSSNYDKCSIIAEYIKKRINKTVVFGGGYPTRYYREILKNNKNIDYITLGDGEAPSEYLYDKLARRKNGEDVAIFHESIASSVDYENKKEYFNTIINWQPAYDYYYKDSIEDNSRKVHCIQIKNNVCTGNCSFCTERHGKVIYKSIDDIVSQIEFVYKTFGVQKIFFTDDNILDPNTIAAKENLKNLCLALKNKKMRLAYQCYFKAFSIEDKPEDHELLKLMREVGFVEVFVGIEAGNPRDLRLYNKMTSVEQNYEIVRLLRMHDIFPIIGYIAFNPYSTRKTITENFNYLCDIECTYLHNYLYSFVVVNKYTAMYDMIKKDGLLLSSEEEYLDVNYKYLNSDIEEVLNYVKNELVPRLRNLNYELDWVTYSMLEHEVWYDDLKDYRKLLAQQKKKDAEWIEKYLGILFRDFNVNLFKQVESEFWAYFVEEENILKEIYDYYVAQHY